MLRALYPSPHEVVESYPAPADGLLALPMVSSARILLPASRKVAPASLRHARRPVNFRSALQTTVVRVALGTGVGRFVCGGYRILRRPGIGSIESVLESVIEQPVRIGIFLGPPRANLKPVLQILDGEGRLLAIAKVGLTKLTQDLAVTEAKALSQLGAGRRSVLTSPELLHFGHWRGHTVLVQSALPLNGVSVNIDPFVRDAAMRELAESNGIRVSSWRTSSYLQRLAGRVAALGDRDVAGHLTGALRLLADTAQSVRFGTWHGDWTVWNMAVRHGRALVWDWERYEPDVPVGFDALHFAFMSALKAKSGPSAAGVELIARSADILRPFEVLAEDAPKIALSYILDLATRYVSDRQADTGVSGGDVTQWLDPVLSLIRVGGISGVGDSGG